MIFPLTILVLSILFAVVAVRNIKLATWLVLLLLPAYLIRFDLGGVPFTFLEVMILVLFAVWFFRHRGYKKLHPNLKLWVAPILILLLAATVSVFVAEDTLSALGIWNAYFIEPVLFFLVAVSVLADYEDRLTAVKYLSVGAIMIVLFALIQYFNPYLIPIPWDIERRVTSVFPYPNALGLYLAPIIALATAFLPRAFDMMRPRYFFLFFFAVVLGLVGIVIAKTEAALVALVGVFLLTLLAFKKGRIVAIALVALGVIVLLAAPGFRGTLIQKVTLQDYSGQVRVSQWQETLPMIQDNWLFGTGLNSYPAAFATYHQNQDVEIFQYPHNIILNIWSELGLLGLIAFTLMILTVIRLLKQGKGNRQELPFLIGTFAALMVMCVHGLVDVPYFKNDLSVLTFGILALLTRSAYKLEEPSRIE